RALSLIPLVGGASGCAAFGGLFQKPTVTLERVEITRIAFDGIGANFVFAVQNPNAIGADLASLRYQLTIDGHALAEGQGNQTLQVPAHGTGALVLPVSIRFVEFAESLLALFQKQVVPYTIDTRLGFQSPAGVIEIPIQSSGTFPVPRLPSVDL